MLKITSLNSAMINWITEINAKIHNINLQEKQHLITNTSQVWWFTSQKASKSTCEKVFTRIIFTMICKLLPLTFCCRFWTFFTSTITTGQTFYSYSIHWEQSDPIGWNTRRILKQSSETLIFIIVVIMFETDVKVYVRCEGRVDNWWWSKTLDANFDVCIYISTRSKRATSKKTNK